MTHDTKPVAPRHGAPADVLDMGTGAAVADPCGAATPFEWNGYDAQDAAGFLVDRVALFADVFAAVAEGCQFAPESMDALAIIARDTHADLAGAIDAMAADAR